VEKISLEAILALAQEESARLKHFYLGVEHLFLALAKLEGGLLTNGLEHFGISPKDLRDQVRQTAGMGDGSRTSSGYPETPRASRVLASTRRIIANNPETTAPEWALLNAILDEVDSLPVRVLRKKGINPTMLQNRALEQSQDKILAILPNEVAIENGERLTDEQRLVLGHMFRRYEKIVIETYFTEGYSGYSGATVLLIRPFHADDRTDAPVIVKLHDYHALRMERERYDLFVRSRLTPKTARIESDLTIPEHSSYGGLKYTFVGGTPDERPRNLAQYAEQVDGEALARFLRHELFEVFGRQWWKQSSTYTPEAWKEYELLLPPALVLEALSLEDMPSEGIILHPTGEWSRGEERHPGEIVALEDFVVIRLKRGRDGGETIIRMARSIQPEAENYACRVDLRGGDSTLRRGNHVGRVVGRISETRDDLLARDIAALEPDFNLMDATLPPVVGVSDALPNPFRRYRWALGQRLSGRYSTIHGDLHTGNILVSPSGDAWLIDFELARDGHTLFDWAVLEISLLTDLIAPKIGNSWAEVRAVLPLINHLNWNINAPVPIDQDHPLYKGFRAIQEVRRIASDLLGRAGEWKEYYIALAFCAFRASGWRERSLAARRLGFLAAGLAFGAAARSAMREMQTAADMTLDSTSAGSRDEGNEE